MACGSASSITGTRYCASLLTGMYPHQAGVGGERGDGHLHLNGQRLKEVEDEVGRGL